MNVYCPFCAISPLSEIPFHTIVCGGYCPKSYSFTITDLSAERISPFHESTGAPAEGAIMMSNLTESFDPAPKTFSEAAICAEGFSVSSTRTGDEIVAGI